MVTMFEDSQLTIEFNFDEKKDKGILIFKGSCRVENIVEVKKVLVEAISNTKEIEIDLSQSLELDLTSIQLLHSFSLSLDRKKNKIKILNTVPDKVVNTIKLSGFTNFISLPNS